MERWNISFVTIYIFYIFPSWSPLLKQMRMNYQNSNDNFTDQGHMVVTYQNVLSRRGVLFICYALYACP